MEQPETRGNKCCGEQHDAVPAEQSAGGGDEYFTEPFLRHGWPVVCMQKNVLVDDHAVLDYPLAEPTMESGVTVGAEEHYAGAGEV